jgi:hypothetical protein
MTMFMGRDENTYYCPCTEPRVKRNSIYTPENITIRKKLNYGYQELPHLKDTDSLHSQEEEGKREHGLQK